MRGIFAGAVVVFVAAVPSAAAAIDYISQFRSLDGTVGVSGFDGNSTHKETSALGFWSETAELHNALASFPSLTIASGFASQTSNVSNQLISMSGDLSAFALSCSSAGSCLFGSGRSELSIEFSVDSPSQYFATLNTTGGTETSIGASAAWDPTGSGTLAPGTYSLSVVFDLVAGSGSSGNGTYLYSLSIVPEPATANLILLGGLLVASRRTGRCRTHSTAGWGAVKNLNLTQFRSQLGFEQAIDPQCRPTGAMHLANASFG